MRTLRTMGIAVAVLTLGLGTAWAISTAGDLDTNFGSSGVADGGDFWVYDAVTLSDGSVVLGGQDRSGSTFHYAVKKLNADDGSADTNFGSGGTADVLGTVGVRQAQLNTLAVGPDDVIYVGGVRILQVNKKGKKVTYVTTGAVLALDPDDGKVVTEFGSSGYVDTDGTVTDIAVAGTPLAYDLTIATVPVLSVTTSSGGKGKKKGGSTTITSQVVGLVRVDQDGSADTSFGSGGIVIGAPSADGGSVARTLEIDGSGRTLVFVTQSSRSTNTLSSYISRYEADGDLDTSYGISGRLEVTSLGTVTDIAIDGDGASVLVAAHDGASDAHEPAVVRYDADGSATADTTFDVPVLTVGGSGGSSDTWTLDLVLDANDRVCVGLWFGSSSSDFTVVRCNADGTRDNTFGPTGNGIAAVADLATQDDPEVLVQDADGNLIIASRVNPSSGVETRVVRWLGGN